MAPQGDAARASRPDLPAATCIIRWPPVRSKRVLQACFAGQRFPLNSAAARFHFAFRTPKSALMAALSLSSKTALITGGGSGIGLGAAIALAREGCRVAIAGRRREVLEEAAAKWKGTPPILSHAC